MRQAPPPAPPPPPAHRDPTVSEAGSSGGAGAWSAGGWYLAAAGVPTRSAPDPLGRPPDRPEPAHPAQQVPSGAAPPYASQHGAAPPAQPVPHRAPQAATRSARAAPAPEPPPVPVEPQAPAGRGQGRHIRGQQPPAREEPPPARADVDSPRRRAREQSHSARPAPSTRTAPSARAAEATRVAPQPETRRERRSETRREARPERRPERARRKPRSRRRNWQEEEARVPAWQRALAGSALVAVSGAVGLAGLKHPITLPVWQPSPVDAPVAAQAQVGAPAPPAVVVDQPGAVRPLDAPLSPNAPGGVASEGKSYPGQPETGDATKWSVHPGRTAQIRAAKSYARSQLAKYGWTNPNEMVSLDRLWTRESGWRWNAKNPSSGAYGIPQSLPARKLAAAGSDWRTNYRTQIDWGLAYIKQRYGTPSKAWAHSEATGWY
jgi:hypothetical protein